MMNKEEIKELQLKIKNGYYTPDLKYHSEPGVRAMLAYMKKDLAYLVNDKCEAVRMAVATVGYGHEILKNDVSTNVKYIILNQNKYLNEFVNDKDFMIRTLAIQRIKNISKKRQA